MKIIENYRRSILENLDSHEQDTIVTNYTSNHDKVEMKIVYGRYWSGRLMLPLTKAGQAETRTDETTQVLPSNYRTSPDFVLLGESVQEALL